MRLGGHEGGGAFTCGAKIGVDSSGVYYVEDVKRGQWSADGVGSELRGKVITVLFLKQQHNLQSLFRELRSIGSDTAVMGGGVLFACEKKGSLGLGLYSDYLLKPIRINTLRFKNNWLCHHW